MKYILRNIIFDIIPVTFGVLIALWISDIKQKEKDKKFRDDLIYSLHQELTYNIKELERSIVLQDTLLKNLMYAKDDKTKNLLGVVLKMKGIKFINLKEMSFYILKTEKIMLFENSMIMNMAKLNGLHQFIKKSQEELLSNFYTNLFSYSQDIKTMLYYMFQGYLNSEKALLHYSKKIKKIIDEGHKWYLEEQKAID